MDSILEPPVIAWRIDFTRRGPEILLRSVIEKEEKRIPAVKW
jgi:hypothetical protein